MIEEKEKEKKGSFFTSWFDKKEFIIPEIVIPESISIDMEDEESESELHSEIPESENIIIELGDEEN